MFFWDEYVMAGLEQPPQTMRGSLMLKKEKNTKTRQTQIPDTEERHQVSPTFGKKKQILILSRPLLYCFLF